MPYGGFQIGHLWLLYRRGTPHKCFTQDTNDSADDSARQRKN